jgi:amino acid permease
LASVALLIPILLLLVVGSCGPAPHGCDIAGRGYVIAGIITVAVMACLAELCVVKPVSASFATYARDTMGPLAGFLTGWNYWLAGSSVLRPSR